MSPTPRSPSSPWLASLVTQSSYSRQAARSLAVLAGGQGGKLLLHIGSTMVLARLLVPEDFGLIAMAATVISFLVLFKDAGLTSATIQQQHLTHTQVSTLFWLNLLVGTALSLLTLASAPLLASLYNRPELIPMVAVLAAGFFLGSLGTQHDALLRRSMAFKRVTVAELSSLALGVIAAVAMAFAGFGWWALVAQKVVQMAAGAAFNWLLCTWRPGFHFNWSEARSQFAFGAHVSGFNFVNYFSRNGDNILIGWYWGAASLGVYAKAYDLLLGPLSQVSAPLHNLMQPLLGRLRDDPARYRAAYLKVMVPANLAMLPIAAIMFVMPAQVVQVLLGPGWQAASGVVMWLGLAVAVQLVGSSTGFVLLSQHRSRDYARLGIASSILTVLSFCIGLPLGIEAVVMCYVFTNMLLIQPMLYYVIGRQGPLGTAAFYQPLHLTLLCAGVMLPALLAVTMGTAAWPALAQLAVAACVAGLSIGGVLLSTSNGRSLLITLRHVVIHNLLKKA